jgi:hypothetical protein
MKITTVGIDLAKNLFDSARFESTKSREIEPACPKMHCTIGGARVFTQSRSKPEM